MNITEQRLNWSQTKSKLKQKFAMLTGNDLLLEEDKEGDIICRVRSKLGKSKEKIPKIVSDL